MTPASLASSNTRDETVDLFPIVEEVEVQMMTLQLEGGASENVMGGASAAPAG